MCVCARAHVCVYAHYIFFIHSFVDEHLGCFHVLTVVNSAAVNIGVHVSFLIRAFVFSEYMPRSGIAGSYGNYIFSVLKTRYTVVHNGCTGFTSQPPVWERLNMGNFYAF